MQLQTGCSLFSSSSGYLDEIWPLEKTRHKKLNVILRPKQYAFPHAAAPAQPFLSVMQSFAYRTCVVTISCSALKNLTLNSEHTNYYSVFTSSFFFPHTYCVPLHLSDSQRTLKCLLHKISRRKEIFKKQGSNRMKSEWKTQHFSFFISKGQNFKGEGHMIKVNLMIGR